MNSKQKSIQRMEKTQLIQKLKDFYWNSGITQQHLADEIGVTVVTVNRWFNGIEYRIHGTTEKSILSFLKKQGQRGY